MIKSKLRALENKYRQKCDELIASTGDDMAGSKYTRTGRSLLIEYLIEKWGLLYPTGLCYDYR